MSGIKWERSWFPVKYGPGAKQTGPRTVYWGMGGPEWRSAMRFAKYRIAKNAKGLYVQLDDRNNPNAQPQFATLKEAKKYFKVLAKLDKQI